MAEITEMDPTRDKPLTIMKGELEAQSLVGFKIIELYKAGKLSIGDQVLVTFIDGNLSKPIVLDLLYKSDK
jgi:hypothetical protein